MTENEYEEIEIGLLPLVHYKTVKKHRGKEYYLAEITTGGGTHGIWLDKKKVDSGEIQIRNKLGKSHSMFDALDKTVRVKKSR